MLRFVFVLTLSVATASGALAQSERLWIEAQAGGNHPVGAYSAGVKPGPAFGLSVGYRIRPAVAAYLGLSHSEFEERNATVLPMGQDPGTATEQVQLQTGFAVTGYRTGLEFHPIFSQRFSPWIGGGLLYQKTDLTAQQRFESGAVTNVRHTGDYTPGYEIVGGLVTPLRSGVTLRPALRFQSHKPKLRGGGHSDAALQQITLSVGIARHF